MCIDKVKLGVQTVVSRFWWNQNLSIEIIKTFLYAFHSRNQDRQVIINIILIIILLISDDVLITFTMITIYLCGSVKLLIFIPAVHGSNNGIRVQILILFVSFLITLS